MNWKTIKTIQVGRIRVPKEDHGDNPNIDIQICGMANETPKQIEVPRKHMVSYRVLIQKGTSTRRPRVYNFTLKCVKCGMKNGFKEYPCPGRIERVGRFFCGKEVIKFLMQPPGVDDEYINCLPHKGGCGEEEFVIVKEN